jgi:predicted outer membrane repeat protein
VSNGGAIYHQDGEVVTSNCLFDSNGTIAGNGGAIFAKTVVDHRSVFNANAADISGGGAVYLTAAGEFNRSLFVGNTAANCAVCDGVVSAVFNNCTAQGNIATDGAASYGRWFNSILFGNTYTSLTCLGGYADGYAEYSDIEGGDGAGGEFGENDSHDNISSDPLYVDDTDAIGADLLWWTGDDGLRLGAGSPCLTASSTGGEIGAYAP